MQPGTGVVQRLRSYQKAPGSGGAGYKIVKLAKKHVKYHPTEADPLFFDEFHVTFELFTDDTKCPKMYFSDQGAPDESHDDDRVNREYRKRYGDFGKLASAAEPIAQDFLDECDRSGARYLNEAGAQKFKEQHEQEMARQEKLKEENFKKADELRAKLKPVVEKSEAEVAAEAKKKAMAEKAMAETGVEARDRDFVRGALIAGSAWNVLIKKYQAATQARFDELMAPPAPETTPTPTATAPEKSEGALEKPATVTTSGPTEVTAEKPATVPKPGDTTAQKPPLVAEEVVAEQEQDEETGQAELEGEDEEEAVQPATVTVTGPKSKAAKRRAKRKAGKKARAASGKNK